MYFAINAQISKDYQLVQAFLKPRCHALKNGVKEPIFTVPRLVITLDKIRVFLFVNPDQSALLLDPNIGWHFAVTSGDRFPCAGSNVIDDLVWANGHYDFIAMTRKP